MLRSPIGLDRSSSRGLSAGWLRLPGGEMVGLLVLDGDSIDQLYVDPDLTCRGIGAQLLDVAKRERPEGLGLWTFVSNQGAQRFYERHGFREVERTDGSRNEERAPDIRLEGVVATQVTSRSGSRSTRAPGAARPGLPALPISAGQCDRTPV
jgi:ribosomal protein S18 acetylase RimI-like enzyme